MKELLRTLVATLAGLLVLFLLVIAVEIFSFLVYPLPADFKGTHEEMCLHVERYPTWVLAVVVPAWAMATYASTWTARRIGNAYSTAIVGLLLLVALVYNISMLPYPTWFKVVNLLVMPAAVFVGGHRSTRYKTTETGNGN